MDYTNAMEEFQKMWTWLYRHPAHDKRYYVKHVVKADPAWRNDCPLCDTAEDDSGCKECLKLWDKGKGSLCADPDSPLSRWKSANLNDPNFRSWYAGQVADLAKKAAQRA